MKDDAEIQYQRTPKGWNIWLYLRGRSVRERAMARLGAQGISVFVLLCLLVSYSKAGEVHEASARGDLAEVKRLVEQNPAAIKEVEESTGAIPLHAAAVMGQKEVVAYLLEKGSPVDAKMKKGKGATPLHLAAFNAQKRTFQLLLRHGAALDESVKKAADGDVYTLLFIRGELGEVAAKKSSKTGATKDKIDAKGIDADRTIDDAALVQIAVLDLSRNLIGVGWKDREQSKIGRTRILDAVKAAANRHGETLEKMDFTVCERLEATSSGTTVSVVIGQEWTEPVLLMNLGHLGGVKFRKGPVGLNLDKMEPLYADTTDCLFEGKVFVRSKGHWVPSEEKRQ